MTRRRDTTALVFALVCAATALGRGQETTPTFRSGVDVIRAGVYVNENAGALGRHVWGLSLPIPLSPARGRSSADAVVTLEAAPFANRVGPGVTIALVALARRASATDAIGDEREAFLALEAHAPGRYEIRLTRDDVDERGHLVAVVDVPDYAKDPVSLSGVVLEAVAPDAPAASNESSVTAVSAERTRPFEIAGTYPFSYLLPVRATARRAFRSIDRVTAFARVYERHDRPLPAALTCRVVDANGHVAFDDRRDLDATAFAGGTAADYRRDIPIDGLAPGHYALTIEARAGDAVAHQATAFDVR